MATPSPSDELHRPPWLARITKTQWMRLDVALTILLIVGAMGHIFYLPRHVEPAPLADSKYLLIPLYLVVTVPIAFRRRWPLTVLALTTVAVVVVTMIGQSVPPVPFIALPLYTVTTTYPRRQSLKVLVAVEGAVGASILVSVLNGRGDGNSSANLLLLIAVWFIADSIRTRRVYLRGLGEQAVEGQRLEIEGVNRAIAEERLEIARELHDVLAHSLSVIAIQSGVGRHVMDDQPEEARRALLAVETTSRSALDELRRVLSVLRRRDSGADRAPTPTLDDLETLVGGVRAAGVRVDLIVEGRVPSLSTGLQLAVYRIVQEALTNVVKHARAATTTVKISFQTGEIAVEVKNNSVAKRFGSIGRSGSRVQLESEDGHGIIGMTERALAFDGTLSADHLPDGGFRVLARLPTKAL